MCDHEPASDCARCRLPVASAMPAWKLQSSSMSVARSPCAIAASAERRFSRGRFAQVDEAFGRAPASQPLEREPHRVQIRHVARLERTADGAAVGFAHDQTLGLERPQGFAQGDAADAEARRQVVLHEPRAGRDLAVHDRGAQGVEQFVVPAAPA